MRYLLLGLALLTATLAFGAAVAYQRGDRVRVHGVDGKPASPAVQRVIAVPRDQIQVGSAGARVNGRKVDAMSKALLKVCGTWDQTVPAGHYVVAGEEVRNESATRSCSLLPAARLSADPGR
jgi:hypothetical protein